MSTAKKQRSFHERPLLRGHLHQAAFFVALGASIMLVVKSTAVLTFIASSVFSFGLLLMLATSSLYHRKYWNPRQYQIMKRVDHSAIFVLIAGTFTPVCLLALKPEQGNTLLIIIWITAAAGILKSILWVKAPKALSALMYVLMGWMVLPYLADLKEALGWMQILLLFLGGLAYMLGAVFYALRRPDLFPTIFEHHELFHLLTIVGAALHFSVIYSLIN